MKKYEKLIVITLIFVMLLNIVQVRELSADFDNLMRAGLIAFLITMNIYNVSVMTRDAVMTLFNSFWNSKTNTEKNDFVNSFKSVWKNSFTSGIKSVALMPLIHNWIRENFKHGYGEYNEIIGDTTIYETDEYEAELTEEIISSDIPYSDIILKKHIYIRGNSVKFELPLRKNNYGYFIPLYNSPNCYFNINGENIGVKISDYQIVNSFTLKFKAEIYGNKIYASIVPYNRTVNRNIVSEPYEVDLPQEINIMYYAGEAVDYPMEKEVEDKYIPLPVPDVGMGIPGLDYDVGGNKVFDGTVDQFLDGALDNADYLDSTIDKLLEGGYATSNPYVNVDAGTITWPAGVTYPDTGVIDYPDVTIPEGVVEGIGETNSILQGIGSFIESIFSAPTVELNLSPLTNVNLKEKFPFCLPFDLATLITGLSNKDKDPPKVDFEFQVFNDSYSIPIDFVMFNDWAVIVNWFVLVLFIIGLVLISRKMIGG